MELALVPDRRLVKIVLALLVLGAAGRFVACTSRPSPPYYLADELIARGLHAHEGREVRVHGFVATGSIDRVSDRVSGGVSGDDAVHRFMLVWHGAGLQVQVRGPLPDMFRDQAEVIVTGRLVDRDGWRIEGTAVIAKCAGKYEGAPPRPREIVFE
jgi:cytochrome c-type biogenesis protein CcmE